jgi:hypothetical protein
MNEETLFHLALEKPAAERPAFLDQACAGDAELRERVEGLLRSHETPDSFLVNPPAEGLERSVDSDPIGSTAEGPGSRIGPYKLLEQIGEGGMGIVYMAEQTQPVRRKVALKIIKPGMDTKQVIARFGAERQALAMMDHPNIAKVHDAGATSPTCEGGVWGGGRPYFVMELVRGIPITEYCDQHQCRSPSGRTCSRRSARPCSTPTRRGSSTGTSSPPTSWSPRSMAYLCPG